MVFRFYYSTAISMKRIKAIEKTELYCCFLSETTEPFVLYESDGVTFPFYNNVVFFFMSSLIC
jgi:hypothetical protein